MCGPQIRLCLFTQLMTYTTNYLKAVLQEKNVKHTRKVSHNDMRPTCSPVSFITVHCVIITDISRKFT